MKCGLEDLRKESRIKQEHKLKKKKERKQNWKYHKGERPCQKHSKGHRGQD